MSGILRVRDGIPRFVRKLAAGEAVRIVAFGTSMTLHSRCGLRMGGRYLERLPQRFRELAKGARIELISSGLEGFTSWWATHRVQTDVVPHDPDLVILEFAHNDDERFASAIELALDGIVAQVRAVAPECEFAVVLLAPRGAAANGPTPAMSEYERLADVYGFPSFDLATLSERLVAEGRAVWDAAGDARALTFDGVHHTALATELLGKPFADAFVQLVRASSGGPRGGQTTGTRPSPALRARCYAPGLFVDERWRVGPASDEIHCGRNVAAYREELAVAEAAGASLRFRFHGVHAQVWALSAGGAVRIVADGKAQTVAIARREPPHWSLFVFGIDLSRAEHGVELTVVEAPVVLGDLFVVGEVLT